MSGCAAPCESFPRRAPRGDGTRAARTATVRRTSSTASADWAPSEHGGKRSSPQDQGRSERRRGGMPQNFHGMTATEILPLAGPSDDAREALAAMNARLCHRTLFRSDRARYGCVQGSGVRVRPDPGVCSGVGMRPA
ncbi:RNaseH domain-containing protein [Streptomyces avermitilis]|uniref:RNaseH domain-containing protein n=1 Tax=Streptomyces avermitilis TaxID=33903 RepID=UPI0034E2CC78